MKKARFVTLGIVMALLGVIAIQMGKVEAQYPSFYSLFAKRLVIADSARVNGLTTINGTFLKQVGATAASATALVLGTGNAFHISGTTTVTSIDATSSITGRQVVLVFDGVLTFTDGSNLKLAGNFVTTADDVITLIYDGTAWNEIARSVN